MAGISGKYILLVHAISIKVMVFSDLSIGMCKIQVVIDYDIFICHLYKTDLKNDNLAFNIQR